MERVASLTRDTSETKISLKVNLDGGGKSQVATGIPFFNHMLELMAKHGFFDLEVKSEGDLEVDFHHSIEDIGIILGEAVKKALATKKGIRRYGFASVPMDEALAQVAIDICNRPHLIYKLPVARGKIGSFDIELVKEFFQALSNAAGITVHINVPYGSNRHHIIEAVFKAFGRALGEAVTIDPRIVGVLSTKGIL
jgi:imidazoleglycerol-phosphate dehydratase